MKSARLRELERSPARSLRRRLAIEKLACRVPLAALVVTTASDVSDSSDGLVSLREAVLEANQNADSSDVITFSPDIRGQTIELTIPFVNVDTPETGDLDITSGEISVVGFDQGSTQIDLSKLGHRAFQVGSNATLRLSNLGIRNGTAARGGAILVEGENSHLELHNVSIQASHADLDGGGIYVGADASLTFVDGDIIKNTAGRGGGVAAFGVATVSGLQIIGNEATDRGGGIFAFGTSANVELHSLALVNNKAGGGSAIANDGGTAYVANATFSGNESKWGGTVLNRAEGTGTAYLRLLQSTIVGDLSEDVGPVHTAARGTANVRTEIGNTIVNDTKGTASLTTFTESSNVAADVISLGHNLFFDDGGGHAADSDLVNVDTVTVPLMDSRVRFRGGNVWVHEPFAGSPAIDAGDPNLAINADGSPLTYDERGIGFSRVSGARVDIGAVEYQAFSADDMIVTSLGDVTDPNDGVVTLREALERANAQTGQDVVRFASALFATGPGKIELVNGSLPIRQAVTIDGPESASLVIDGLANTRVIDIWFGDFDVTLKGLTITGGATYADDDYLVFNNAGPAVRSQSSGTLTLDSVTIQSNHTKGAYSHGAVSAVEGDVIIRDSLLRENTTSGYRASGAAVYVWSHKATFEDSELSDNAALGPESHGGAVFVEYGDFESVDSLFASNVVAGYAGMGGAIAVNGGDASLERTIVRNNQTKDSYGNGGGIWVAHRLDLIDSQVVNNRTEGYAAHGGGINSNGTVVITRSTVSGNITTQAEARGGGLAFDGYIDGGSLQLDASILFDNVSKRGSDLWLRTNNSPSVDVETSLVGLQQLVFGDHSQWRLGVPLVRDSKLLLTAFHVDAVLSRLIIETDLLWTNPLSPSDIDNNGEVSALDALAIINELNVRRYSDSELGALSSPESGNWAGVFYDQNGDGRVSASDALGVINDLNRATLQVAVPSGEFANIHEPSGVNPNDRNISETSHPAANESPTSVAGVTPQSISKVTILQADPAAEQTETESPEIAAFASRVQSMQASMIGL